MIAPPAGPIRDAVLLHDAAALAGDAAARDVLDQMRAIEGALRDSGVRASRLPADLDLGKLKRRLGALRPGVVVNLVESLDGSDRLQTVIPMLLEDWRIPFTGSGSAAMLLANHKLAAKERLALDGLPVPPAARRVGDGLRFYPEGAGEATGGDWIIKTLESHASLFLDDDSVLVGATPEEVEKQLAQAEAARGVPFFAEGYVDGREFNLSLLENSRGEPEVLPIAEISFAGLPSGKPRIVGYAAKWEEEADEYKGTERTFEPGPDDTILRSRLAELALACWRSFDLAGYARVDFRVDAAGNPFILEANANPCLTPGAGFAAAAERGGMSYADMIGRIVLAGLRRQ